MAKLLYIQQVEVYDDGSEKIIAKFQPYVEGGTPPPPPEDKIYAARVETNSLNVRNEPNIGGLPFATLDKGQNFFLTLVPTDTPKYDKVWVWGVIVKQNGDNSLVGKFVAIKRADGTGTPLVSITDELNPPKASLYPTMKRTYGTRTFNSIQIDGSNSRQQIGANFTFGLWMVEGNGAIIDESLKANGVTNKLTKEELDKFNKPNWVYPPDEEPYNGHILRVRVKNKRYGLDQTIKNGHEFMKLIKTYTAGVPYIRVLFCFTDTFGQYPNLYFQDEQAYHDQPQAKTGNRYWNDEVWRRNLLPFAKGFIEAMQPYADYIFGWQTGNEFALNAPQNGGANIQAIDDYIGGQNELATTFAVACERKHHIMTGQRTAHDIYQETMDSATFYKKLYKNSDLTCVNFHPYCNKPPIVELTPTAVFREWGYMQKDLEGATLMGLPIVADEMGTYQDGYGFAQPQRDEVLKYSLQYLQWVCGVWCCKVWNQMLRVDIDRGYGDAERGFSAVRKNAQGVSVAVTSTPGAVKVAHDHAGENYKRG